MAKEIPPQFQQQALNDLTMRAKSGIYIYVAIWLVIVVAFDFWSISPAFVVVNSALILISMAVRLLHMQLVRKASEESIFRLYQALVFIVLFSAAHWGVLTAWVISLEQSPVATQLLLIVLPAFAMGGASTLSISNTLRLCYPLALYAPPIMVFFYQESQLSLIYAVSAVISYIYVISASKYSRENYWSAIRNQLLAKQRAEELELLSSTDPLTKLKNRLFFDKKFDNEWRRCAREKAPMSVIMIDFDHFKKVNDKYGHLFGDEVLRRASALFCEALKRPTDCVARYGGEEFVAILANTDEDGARMIAERIRKAIEEMAIEYQGQAVAITCSIGGATMVPKEETAKTDLLKRADSALYQAKDRGRNCYFASEA